MRLASNVQVDISSPVAYVMSVREDQEVNHVKVHCFSLLVNYDQDHWDSC